MTTTEQEVEGRVERGPEQFAADDPFWPAQLAVLAALILYIALPDKLTLGPDWLLPAAEGLLLTGLVWASPWGRRSETHPWRRIIALVLTGFVTAANTVALALLIHFVVKGGRTGGYELVLSGAEIWATAVLIFAVVYWELDGGGPTEGLATDVRGLPLRLVHELHGLQPDGHDAHQADDEVADDAAGAVRADHDRRGGRARHQSPRLTHSSGTRV